MPNVGNVTQQVVVTTPPGESLNSAFVKINNDFANVWAAGPVGSNVSIVNNSINTLNTNGGLVLSPNGIGNVVANAHIIPDQTRIRNLGSSTKFWNTVYTQYLEVSANLNIAGNIIYNGDLNVTGNLTVQGNIIQVGNIVTETLTIQLANAAGTANAANGSGITVGANDDIATLLYNSTGNVWTTNIGISSVGNITAPYFIGNGSLLTGLAATYGNANVAAYLPTYSGNISAGNVGVSGAVNAVGEITSFANLVTTGEVQATGNVVGDYFIGNGSQLTGIVTSSYANANVVAYGETGWAGNIIPNTSNVYSLGNSTNQWSDLYVSNATIYMNNIPIGLTAGNVLTVDGNAVVTTNTDGQANIGNIGISGTTIYIADGAEETIISISPDIEGQAYIQVPNDAMANVANVRIHNDAGNIEFGTDAGSRLWYFDNTGKLTLPINGDINFDGGNIYQTQNEDFYVILKDQDNDDWGLYNRVNDGNDTTLSQTRLRRNEFTITTDYDNDGFNWSFDNFGVLNLPGNINGAYAADTSVYAVNDGTTGSIELKTISFAGETLLSNVRVGNDNVTISTATNAYSWTFDNAGNLTAPGNIQSISTGFPFSSGIIGIDNTNPAVITVADSVFPDVVTGRVTISGVNPPVQANGTWYYEAVETNQFALYLDAGLTQPVDATGWPGYVDGGLAVSPGYSNLAITGGNVSIVSQFGETWTFEAGGALRIPNDIVSNATIDLDNRASSNTADIRLFAADDIFLQGRDKPDDVEAEGGDIFLYGGDGANAATSGLDTGSGGDVQIEGGIGGVGQASGTVGAGGGIITITGGDGGSSLDSTVGSGGSVNISAGSAADPISEDPTLGGIGGSVNISAGTTTRINDNGGSIELTTGNPTLIGTGAAGYVAINIASSNVGAGGNWTFMGTGTTLNVPANAEIFGANAGNLTVGCAGNTIVTSSDYGANVKNWVFGYTGNLTVPGNSIVSTADATGGAGGNSITIQAGAADQSNFFDTPGGNVNIAGGLGAFNDGGGGGPGGDVNITGGLSSDPAGHAGNVNIGSGTSGWTFDYTGNVTLPRGGVVYETNIPFGGLEGNTIALKPSGGTDADQQLLVYPTAGVDFNHLHLTTGNLWNTEMFLGNDDFYVKLANTGNVVINSNDNGGNTYQLNFTPFGEMRTTGSLFIQTPNGVPNGVTAITGSSGSWESNPTTDLATTNGTGAGLTVTVTETGGYASAIAIVNPGSGYANGDEITVTSGSSSATFTISVANNQWILDTEGELTLPTISLGESTDEQTVISSQRKLIPPFRWSAEITGTTPTVVYTATDVQTTSMKVTMQIQHGGVGMEFFEVFATESANDTYYTVSNRVAPPALDASTVVVDLNGSNEMQITVTINSGAGTSWVTYDAVEFGIPND